MKPVVSITAETQADETVVRVKGELGRAAENELVDVVKWVSTDFEVGAVVNIDLTAVDFIGSSGLKGLMRCRDVVTDRGGQLRLTVVDGPVKRLLALAGAIDSFSYS